MWYHLNMIVVNSSSATSLFWPLVYFISGTYSSINIFLCNTRSQSWSMEFCVRFLWLVYTVIFFPIRWLKTLKSLHNTNYCLFGVFYPLWESVSFLENIATIFLSYNTTTLSWWSLASVHTSNGISNIGNDNIFSSAAMF